MLDLGFLPDIEKLLAMLPSSRQTMLFSATMPGPIVALARQFLSQPMQIRAEHGTSTPATEHVDQFVYRAHAMDKAEVLARVLQARGRGLTMIFTRTKRTAQKVADDLADRGFAAAAVHGDLGQGAREQALRAFRSGKVDVLVATDVAARGLDVEGVTHVINYQCPEDEKTYVHRIGRTARAGASGIAVTFVDWDDLPRWKLICDQLDLPFHEPAETYSTSPHLYLELDIPDGVGRHAAARPSAPAPASTPRRSRTSAAATVPAAARPASRSGGGSRSGARGDGGRSGWTRQRPQRRWPFRRNRTGERSDGRGGARGESGGRTAADRQPGAAAGADASNGPRKTSQRSRSAGAPAAARQDRTGRPPPPNDRTPSRSTRLRLGARLAPAGGSRGTGHVGGGGSPGSHAPSLEIPARRSRASSAGPGLGV